MCRELGSERSARGVVVIAEQRRESMVAVGDGERIGVTELGRDLEATATKRPRSSGRSRARVGLYMTGSPLTFEDGDISVFQVLAARRGARSRAPVDRREPIRTEALV
jgi:hypothetical protein